MLRSCVPRVIVKILITCRLASMQQHFDLIIDTAKLFLFVLGGNYLIRKIIDQEMSKRLEEYRLGISSVHSKNIIVFQRFHEKQM